MSAEITDEPADSVVYGWAGLGELRDFTVSNTLKWAIRHDGRQAVEYPAGSGQYYLFSSGFWFGALYPRQIQGADIAWIPSVSKAVFNCDMGAMSVPEMANAGSMGDISGIGLYYSDMIIPSGYEGAGEKLFVQPGQIPKFYQTIWPFADVMLNQYLPPESELDPEQGDIFADQSTFAVGGD
ncbi:hypothetical protein JXM67_10885 [candidate division WOR-3 bacterium]|nr:hypothetical protein [candidate division WOR-3 bacterium]